MCHFFGFQNARSYKKRVFLNSERFVKSFNHFLKKKQLQCSERKLKTIEKRKFPQKLPQPKKAIEQNPLETLSNFEVRVWKAFPLWRTFYVPL